MAPSSLMQHMCRLAPPVRDRLAVTSGGRPWVYLPPSFAGCQFSRRHTKGAIARGGSVMLRWPKGTLRSGT